MVYRQKMTESIISKELGSGWTLAGPWLDYRSAGKSTRNHILRFPIRASVISV